MAHGKKVLVVGASGLVGAAAIKAFRKARAEVIAVSRRPPLHAHGARVVAADLLDEGACRRLFGQMPDVTHLVYAALHERPSLVAGWGEIEQIAVNARMFRNVFDPISDGSASLRHVTLLQGTKAYGVHVRPLPVPAREDRDELHSHPNFYWNQEAHMLARQHGADWSWTILRPVLVVGQAVGSAMNVAAALGAFGALLKEEGRPLAFPGGAPRVAQAVDADLLARAVAWAGEAKAAADQIFNVTNGDVFVWQNVWPAIAEVLGMETGAAEPRSLESYCAERGALWDRIREKYRLQSPTLRPFVGASPQYCDYLMRYGETDPGPPSIVSTVKIQAAGFHDVMDTEAMFRKWLRTLMSDRLLPSA